MSGDDLQSSFTEERLLGILEITKKLAAHFDLKEMVYEVLEAAKGVLKADGGSVWLFNEGSGRLEMYLPEITPRVSVDAGEGLVGECFASRRVINVADCYADSRFNPEVDRSTGYVTRTMLSVPLKGVDEAMVGVMQLLNRAGGPFSTDDEKLAEALAAQSALALQRARMMQALLAQERVKEEMTLAREMQMSTFPSVMPQVPGYELAGGFVPAEQVGGDMFDLAVINDRLFILLGDATGHGFGSALSSMRMHAMLKAALRMGAPLGDAVRALNNQLAEDLPDNRFLTAFIGFLDPARHRVDYQAPGQGPIMVFRAASSQFEWLPPTTFPVGVMPSENVEPASVISLGIGDILGVISDGLFEHEDSGGDPFGESRVEDIVRRYHTAGMEQLRLRLMEAASAHGDGRPTDDDITMVLVRRTA